MNYALAKELKDAGFPQGEYVRCRCMFPEERKGSDGKAKLVYSHDEPSVYVPTLSELIEACGDDFNSLVQRNAHQCWGAMGTGHYDERGPTPEEAVARLWLALNPLKK